MSTSDRLRALAEEHAAQRQALAQAHQDERRALGLDDARASGSELIAQERARQIQEEGYDAAHDAGQGHALARAGVAYAIAGTGVAGDPEADHEAWSWWPWSREAWKPDDEDMVRNLVRAGALIAAAIDAHMANPWNEFARSQPGNPVRVEMRRNGQPVPDPGLAMEDAIETASDGGEL